MTLVFHRSMRSRLETVHPFFERLQTDRHPFQKMVLPCSWSTERSMGHGFARVTPPSEGCGDALTDQARIPSYSDQ